MCFMAVLTGISNHHSEAQDGEAPVGQAEKERGEREEAMVLQVCCYPVSSGMMIIIVIIVTRFQSGD